MKGKEDKKPGIGFNYAWRGIKWVVINERNMQIHMTFVILVAVTAVWIGISHWEAVVLLVVITLVLAMEMVNSALEQIVNLCVGTNYHPLAKRAKDIGAGAVLIAAVNSVIIGLIIFWPKLWLKLKLVFSFLY